MQILRIAYYLAGLILLALILSQTDVDAVVGYCMKVGLPGLMLVLVLHLFTFLTDVLSWQLTFTSPVPGWRWTLRLYLVRLSGEAFNNVLPMASMGGEPMKMAVLKSHYGIGLSESAGTLLLARTINLFALMLFLFAGFYLLWQSPQLTGTYTVLAAAGLLGLGIGTLLFFLIQRCRLSSRLGRRLHRSRWGHRLERLIHAIESMDEQLVQFYTQHHRPFVQALLLAVSNWFFGVAEIWLVMRFIGVEITVTDAWILEAMAQLIRTAVFFIPSAIGAQEGVLMLMTTALTGNPAHGVALAVVRRARELFWIVLGLLVYARYSRAIPEPTETQQ